jgi:hypothetical protein
LAICPIYSLSGSTDNFLFVLFCPCAWLCSVQVAFLSGSSRGLYSHWYDITRHTLSHAHATHYGTRLSSLVGDNMWCTEPRLMHQNLAPFFLPTSSHLFPHPLTSSHILPHPPISSHSHSGTMNISLLTGRILVGDVVYSTKDSCIRIVDCIITFRWWIKSVRESAVVNGIPLPIFILFVINNSF